MCDDPRPADDLRDELEYLRRRISELQTECAAFCGTPVHAGVFDGYALPELVTLLPHTLFEIDAEGRIIFLNRKGMDLFRFEHEDAYRTLTIYDLLAPSDRERAARNLRCILNGGATIGNEYLARRADGSTFPILVFTSMAAAHGNSVPLRGIMLDITERKRFEDRLKRTGKLDSISRLAGRIAHEYSNILTVILGSISLAKLDLELGSEAYAAVTEAEKATCRAKELTHTLLALSQCGMPVNTKAVPLLPFLETAVRDVLDGSRVFWKIVAPDGSWEILGDEGQLRTVIRDLLVNAVQAMPDGGNVEIEVTRHIQDDTENIPIAAGSYVRISLRDHGTGIEPAVLSRIFDPFFSTKECGSGLGLSTAYAVLQKLKGYLDVESQPGEGTVFHLFLPEAVRQTAGAARETELSE